MPAGHGASTSRATTIEPLLSVRRGAAAIEFYHATFGATTLTRIDAEDGAVVARLAVGDATFWVADESPTHQNFSPESLGGATTRLILTVGDPHAIFASAVRAGAKMVAPVTAQPYGWLVGRVEDPFGHHWEIGKPLTTDDAA